MQQVTTKIKLEDLYGKCLYQVQYFDGPSFTVPLTLNKLRAERFLNDQSVKAVKLTLPNGLVMDLELT